MAQPVCLAFYDLDGTLVSSNIVTQYAYVLRHSPARLEAAFKYTKLLMSVPAWILVDFYSRRRFNQIFFREYRGMQQAWLLELAEGLFEEVLRPAVFPGAKELVSADRRQGFRTVLLTGTPDFALQPVIRYFGFDHVICNELLYDNGTATGQVRSPLIAEREKVEAILRLSREHNVDTDRSKAYTDSFSDVPMLEAVGFPSAVNPDRRLRRLAIERGWPVLDLKNGNVPTSPQNAVI